MSCFITSLEIKKRGLERFTNLISKYLLSTCYVPESMLDAGM